MGVFWQNIESSCKELNIVAQNGIPTLAQNDFFLQKIEFSCEKQNILARNGIFWQRMELNILQQVEPTKLTKTGARAMTVSELCKLCPNYANYVRRLQTESEQVCKLCPIGISEGFQIKIQVANCVRMLQTMSDICKLCPTLANYVRGLQTMSDICKLCPKQRGKCFNQSRNISTHLQRF